MCVDNLNLVWRNAPYKGAQLLVLVAIADWSGEHGDFNYSVPALAARSRISERSVQRYMAAFVKSGALILVAESEMSGQGRTYRLGVTYCHPIGITRVTKRATTGDAGVAPNKENVKARSTKNQPPLPSFPKGREFLTVRQTRQLNGAIYGAMNNQRVDFKTAVETACAELLIPLDLAWAQINAAGVGDAKRPTTVHTFPAQWDGQGKAAK